MKADLPFRFAVVGCGRMGRERAAAASAFGGKLVVACDIVVSRAREMAASHDALVVGRFHAREWSNLDAVFVCTPPFARGAVELDVVRTGIALFLEKPVGITAASALPLLKELERTPVLNAVGYMNRYRRSVDEARRIVRELGVLGISGHWMSSPYQVEWREHEELSGGGINDEATHLIDLFRYLVGEIVAVQALHRTASSRGDLSGTVAASLQFESGMLGTLLYSGESTVKQIGLRLHTPKGEVQLNGWDFDLRYDGRHVPGRPRRSERGSVFTREVQSFVDAVRHRKPALIRSTVADAVRTQSVVDRVRESMKARRALPVNIQVDAVNV